MTTTKFVSFIAVVMLAAACSSAGSGAESLPAETDPVGPTASPADGSAQPGQSDSATDAGSDSGSESEQGSPAGSAAEPTDGEIEPGSIEALEAGWLSSRTAVVESIRRSGYGVDDDNVLRGPAGFEVDLDDCPADWDDRAGTDGSIVIAQTAPKTGELWAYGLIADGLAIYFDHVNRTGGVAGKQLDLQVIDDGYDSTRTVELVEDLLASGTPFAVTTFGGPTSFAVTEQLNEQCIPQPFVMSNHPAWGDPGDHPWTTGLQLAYNSEALLWGRWIKQNMGGELPVTVAALVVDSEFGRIYEAALSDWAADNPDVIADFVPVRHPERASAVSEEMRQIAAVDPDVFIAMTNESPCLLAVLAAGEVELAESGTTLFTSSVCRNADSYMIPAGAAADGFHILGGGWKTTTDPDLADDPYIRWVNSTLTEANVDTAIGFFGTGFAYYGWAYVEALRIAAELDGGLTRSNLVLAQRAMNLEHPGLLPGIQFSMEGAGDGYFVEGSDVSVFDAATGTWQPAGSVVDLNGLTPSCSWRDSVCR